MDPNNSNSNPPTDPNLPQSAPPAPDEPAFGAPPAVDSAPQPAPAAPSFGSALGDMPTAAPSSSVPSDSSPAFGMPPAGEPIPTFTPPAPSAATPPTDPVTTFSPGVLGSSPADSAQMGTLTGAPTDPSPLAQPENSGGEVNTGFGGAPNSSEASPTDLSHLVGTSESTEGAAVPSAEAVSPQTLVVPTPPTSDANSVVTGSGSGGFPKWIFILGGVILLAVIGASAYFIMGVGRPAAPAVSVPVEQQSVLSRPKSIIPSEQPLVTAPLATNSGGTPVSLPNAQPSSSVSTSTSTSTSSSAIELLRQRQR